MTHANVYNSHPREYGRGSREWYVFFPAFFALKKRAEKRDFGRVAVGSRASGVARCSAVRRGLCVSRGAV